MKVNSLNLKAKILILLLLILLLLDVVLLFVYYKSPSKIIRILNTLTKGKSFTDLSNTYPRSSHEVKVTSGPLTLPDSKTFTFLAIIADEPYLDNKIKEYVLPLKFINTNNNVLKANLALGKENANRNILLAPKGIISDYDKWNIIKTKVLIQYPKKNDPIIVKIIYFSNNDFKILGNDKVCNDKCKSALNFFKELSNNTYTLYSSLVNNKNIKNNLNIGYPYTMILYD